MPIASRFSHFYFDGEAGFLAGEPFDPGHYLMDDEAADWRAGWLAASQTAALKEVSG